MHPDADAFRLVRMCLVHDLLESRTGDLNLVQKQYVISDEKKAKEAMVKNIPFGQEMAELLAEFEKGETLEARLARDADQLSFILDLKSLSDMGHLPARKWLNFVIQRLVTPTGKKIAETILATEQDAWWLKLFNPIDA
jgi:putative hydrolase of HD superfamily